MELKAYQAYRNPELDLTFWRTAGGFEVDFILGNLEVAIEGNHPRSYMSEAGTVHEGDLRGLRALLEERRVKHPVVVSLEAQPRIMDKRIHILPWKMFLERLWDGHFGV